MLHKIKTMNKKKLLITAVPVILLLIIAAGGFFAYRSYTLSKQIDQMKNGGPKVSDAEAKKQADQLKKEISKYLLLPDEEPTVATVQDVGALQNNPFFKNAQNGDKVLVFTQAQKALIYRQKDHKIIEVGYFNPTQAAQPTPQVALIKVAVRSGTGSEQVIQAMEQQLKTSFPGSAVTERGLAKKSDYQKSQVIDVTGNNLKQVQDMSAKLGLSVSQMPSGETPPAGADILIIVGKQ